MIDSAGKKSEVYNKSHIPEGPGYNEKYYLDGGLTGNMVYSEDHKNYIGIYITTRCECDIENINMINYIIINSEWIHWKVKSCKICQIYKLTIKTNRTM